MKEIVHVARSRGIRVRCEGCHTDSTTHALAAGAREQLDRLLLAEAPILVVPVAPARVPPRRHAGR
jgi:hypothetical protein